MIDNTFASPINFRPVELGCDVSLHSATKYLNGHSDLIAGAAMGSSLGGVETLISRPAALSHAGLTDEERAKTGISDALVRVSVGIEDPQDIIEDFDAALR